MTATTRRLATGKETRQETEPGAEAPRPRRYHGQVTCVFRTLVQVETPQEAETAALRAVCARPGIRAEHVTGVSVSPLAPSEERELETLRSWQESEILRAGTWSQRQRWLSQTLPEDELLGVAREHLFRPLGLHTRRRPITYASLHGTGARECPSDISWSTTADPVLTASEWESLVRVHRATDEVGRQAIMRLSGNEISTEAREHRGACRHCNATVSQRSVLVQIQWAGRTLSREYIL